MLKTELSADPLARGYTAMTDEQIADDLNTAYRTRPRPRMSGSEVLNAVVKSEYDALSPDAQQLVWNVLHLGEINPFGIEADVFVSVFGTNSATIAALAEVRFDSISRAQELGLRRVLPGHVAMARVR